MTNGPLLRPTVAGRPPGHVFRQSAGQSFQPVMDLKLATKDKIEYLELIKNGMIVEVVRLDEYAERRGQLSFPTFERSGWFLVRAVTSVPKTYRFATSGPYYVQIGDDTTVSRRSANFFNDWVSRRANTLQTAEKPTENEATQFYRQALVYWQQIVDQANVN